MKFFLFIGYDKSVDCFLVKKKNYLLIKYEAYTTTSNGEFFLST